MDDRKGALQKDMDADVLILDRELNIRAAWAMGRLVEHYGRKLFHLAKIVKNLHSLNTIETLLPTLLIFL